MVYFIDIFRGNPLSGGFEPLLSWFSPKNPEDQFLSALFDGQKGHNPEKKVAQKIWPWFVGFAEPSDQDFFAIQSKRAPAQEEANQTWNEINMSRRLEICTIGWQLGDIQRARKKIECTVLVLQDRLEQVQEQEIGTEMKRTAPKQGPYLPSSRCGPFCVLRPRRSHSNGFGSDAGKARLVAVP